jgi:hypothetical protein
MDKEDLKDLTLPRLVYRGEEDVLGEGLHTNPETGELVGETKTVSTPEELAQAKKDGWRLTAEDPDATPPEAEERGGHDPTGRPHPDHDLPGRPAGPARPKAKR